MPIHARLHRTARARAMSAAAAALLLSVACGPVRAGPITQERAMVVFSNESLAEATLFATSTGSTGYRLGTVMPGRTDTLAIPISVTGRGTVSFYVDLLAHPGRPTSGNVSISTGDWVQLRLPSSTSSLLILPAP